MVHTHSIIDDDAVLTIDPASRSIQNQNDFPERILQGDHNCERLTFSLPLEIDGHDMTQCNLVRVHFANIGEENQRIYGVEDISDLRRDEYDPDIAICSWLISGKATRLVGKLHFCIQFACVKDGLITYSWSTAICTKLAITSSMDNTDVDDVYNKTINDVPFTVDDKNKLNELPSSEEFIELRNSVETKVPVYRYNLDDGLTIYDTDIWYMMPVGVSYVIFDINVDLEADTGIESAKCYRVHRSFEHDPDFSTDYWRIEDLKNGEIKSGSLRIDEPQEFIDWKIVNDGYSKSEIDDKIGDINAALDELHNYAQALVSGGAQ